MFLKCVYLVDNTDNFLYIIECFRKQCVTLCYLVTMLSVGLTRFPGRLDRPYSSMRRLMLETVISAVRTLEILSFALLALQSPVYGNSLIWLQRNIFVQDIRELHTGYNRKSQSILGVCALHPASCLNTRVF